jgi:hypothetical protein
MYLNASYPGAPNGTNSRHCCRGTGRRPGRPRRPKPGDLSVLSDNNLPHRSIPGRPGPPAARVGRCSAIMKIRDHIPEALSANHRGAAHRPRQRSTPLHGGGSTRLCAGARASSWASGVPRPLLSRFVLSCAFLALRNSARLECSTPFPVSLPVSSRQFPVSGRRRCGAGDCFLSGGRQWAAGQGRASAVGPAGAAGGRSRTARSLSDLSTNHEQPEICFERTRFGVT